MRNARTRLSSKGQIVIPAWVRRTLDLAPGDEFSIEIPEGSPKVIVLRSLSGQDIERLLEKGYRWLKENAEDLVSRLHEARRAERKREKKRRRA